jgi:hypothetical protein
LLTYFVEKILSIQKGFPMKFLILIPIAVFTTYVLGSMIVESRKQPQTVPQSTSATATLRKPIAPSPVLAKVGEVVAINDRAIKVLGVRAMNAIQSGSRYILERSRS